MKNKLSRFTLLTTLAVWGLLNASCGNIKNVTNFDLDIVTPTPSTIMVPAAGFTCVGQGGSSADLTKQYFEIKDVSFVWRPTANDVLNITTVKIRLTGPQISGFTYEKTIDSAELESSFNSTTWSTLVKDQTVTTKASCGLRVGGLSPILTGTVPGQIIVDGYSQDADGTFRIVHAQAPISVRVTTIDP